MFSIRIKLNAHVFLRIENILFQITKYDIQIPDQYKCLYWEHQRLSQIDLKMF